MYELFDIISPSKVRIQRLGVMTAICILVIMKSTTPSHVFDRLKFVRRPDYELFYFVRFR